MNLLTRRVQVNPRSGNYRENRKFRLNFRCEESGIRLCGLNEAQKRALRLADNKICANAGWDPELVAQELEFLSSVEIDFNVEVTGFETAEIDLLIEASEARDKENPDDEVNGIAKVQGGAKPRAKSCPRFEPTLIPVLENSFPVISIYFPVNPLREFDQKH